jgi:dsDNA-binding SOS-regulon protein
LFVFVYFSFFRQGHQGKTFMRKKVAEAKDQQQPATANWAKK